MITTAALIEELRILGQVDVPQASLNRVWLRVLGELDVPEGSQERGLRHLALEEYRAFVEVPWDLIIEDRERRAREMANVLATAQAVEADNPSVSPSGIAAQGRARACPAAHSFQAPAFGPGKTLPGLRPVSPPDTAPAPVPPAGVGGPSGVDHA